MARQIANKNGIGEIPLKTKRTGDVEFCLNCDDMDDLAVDPRAQRIESARERFNNCEKTGKFEGDVCSRLYVLDPTVDPGPIFDEE